MELFSFISRNGTRIIAGAALIGLALPSLSEAVRPYLGHLVVIMLVVSLLRVEFAAFLARVRRPLPAACAAVWITLVLPLAVLSAAVLVGPPLGGATGLAVLFLFSAPSPIVSAPAFAMLMGLDGALVLAVLLIGTLLMPLTAPWIASLFVAETLPIGAVDLAIRLALMVGGAYAAAWLLRRVLGPRRIGAAKPVFDTLSVTVATLFAIGAMDGVTARLIAEPLFTLAAMLGAFAFAFAQMAATYGAFRPFVGVDAVAIAYASGSRNAGFVVAALGVTAIDETIWLFFALSQLPIFFIPLVLKPLGRRLAPPRPIVA